MLLFGAGGQLVEVFKDRALGLPRLNATLARRLMEQTRIFAALRGTRGRPPVDFAALTDILVRFSQLVAELRGIKDIDTSASSPSHSASSGNARSLPTRESAVSRCATMNVTASGWRRFLCKMNALHESLVIALGSGLG